MINCNCPEIKIVNCVKYLGLNIDSHLSWDHHIFELHKKIRPLNLLFYNLKKFMSTQSMIPIYYAFYQSRLQYGLCFWGSAGISKINKIIISQKFAVRMIGHQPVLAHTSEIFKTLNFFPVQILCKKLVLKFFINNILNDVNTVRARNTRLAATSMVTLPDYRKTRSRDSLLYKGCYFFNEFVRKHPQYHNNPNKEFNNYISFLLFNY